MLSVSTRRFGAAASCALALSGCNATQKAQSVATQTTAAVAQTVDTVSSAAGAAMSSASTASAAMSSASSAASTAATTMTSAASTTASMMSSAASTVAATVSSAASAVSSAASAVSSAAASTASTVSSAASTAASAVSSAVSSMVAAVTGTSQTDKENDAARLAQQATFGATPAVINRIVQLGVNGWLDEQFAATGSTYADYASQAYVFGTCGLDTACFYARYSRWPTAMRLYSNALSQPDQLRQRVAMALGQIIVASGTTSAGTATFNQIFLENAFGNYRTILQKTMMTCLMGTFLNMDTSAGWSPNENYAREMMQLFTMGPNKLNMDGTPVLDSTGAVVPNYTQDDVKNIARALTGWGCQEVGYDGFGTGTGYDFSKPMRSLAYAWRFDDGRKTFLGTTTGSNQDDNIQAVLDATFYNPSTAPFISKQLIQHLVTANPSPAYVGRVAAVFANNGSNVRGDLKAVVRAILTDAEARATSRTGDTYGKLKEPALLLTAVARATGMTSDGWVFTQHDGELGQLLLYSPSVFNFYPPNFPLPKSATLLSPASKLMTSGTIVNRHNVIYGWTIGAATTPAEFAATQAIALTTTGTSQDWSSWEALGTDVNAMLDRADLILTARSLSTGQKTVLKKAITAITDADPAKQARLRAQTLIYLIATSPLFQVDR